MGRNKKKSTNIKLEVNHNVQSADKNAHKIQLLDCVKEFSQSAKEKLEHISTSDMKSSDECNYIKQQVLCFKSELDKFINRFVGLELQVKKNAELLQCLPIHDETVHSNAHQITKREHNIVIHGLCNDSTDTRKNVKLFLSQSLGVKSDVIHAKPLGKEKKSTLVMLSSMYEKLKIFKNCHKRKGQPMQISITKTNEKKKKLMPIYHSEKQKGKKTFFRLASLYVNGQKIIQKFITSNSNEPVNDMKCMKSTTADVGSLVVMDMQLQTTESTFSDNVKTTVTQMTTKDALDELPQILNHTKIKEPLTLEEELRQIAFAIKKNEKAITKIPASHPDLKLIKSNLTALKEQFKAVKKKQMNYSALEKKALAYAMFM